MKPRFQVIAIAMLLLVPASRVRATSLSDLVQPGGHFDVGNLVFDNFSWGSTLDDGLLGGGTDIINPTDVQVNAVSGGGSYGIKITFGNNSFANPSTADGAALDGGLIYSVHTTDGRAIRSISQLLSVSLLSDLSWAVSDENLSITPDKSVGWVGELSVDSMNGLSGVLPLSPDLTSLWIAKDIMVGPSGQILSVEQRFSVPECSLTCGLLASALASIELFRRRAVGV
jgi:hypothetical protein